MSRLPVQNYDVAPNRTFMTAGDALSSALHDVAGLGLGTHPGRGVSVLDWYLGDACSRAPLVGLPPDKIGTLISAAYAKGEKLCESPIERDVLAALLTAPWETAFGVPSVHDPKQDDLIPSSGLVIIPQAALFKYRADFLLMSHKKMLCIVECDGSEYHGNFDRERQRDAYFASFDVATFHMKGSEIYADTAGSVRPVVAALNEWAFSP